MDTLEGLCYAFCPTINLVFRFGKVYVNVGLFKTALFQSKIKDLVLCGSNAEKTRVWGRNNEIEFDYLAVMKTWPGIENFRFEHCADGQIEVQFLVNGEDNPFLSRQHISLYEATEVFHRIVNKCFKEKCQQNLCPKFDRLYRFETSALNCCKFCSVSMNTGILKHVWTKTSDLKYPGKIEFLWKSKYKSIKSIDVNEIFTQYQVTRHYLQAGFPLPEWCQCKDRYYETLYVPVDFHPVIEIDQSAKVHEEFRIFPRESYLLLPPSYVRATQTVARNQWRTLKDRELACFVLKLIFNRTPMVKVIPKLDRRTKFYLFPRSDSHVSHGCWRISSCLQERDILYETSEEHRKAYCLLKFLASVLFRSTNIIEFHNYEIKISVINHIIHCKNPSVGAHVCMLSIMQEIYLCRSKGIMEHPFLHLNLYDMIRYFDCDKKRLIGFRVLILLLANEKGMYTLEDLFNDFISVTYIYEEVCGISFHFPTKNERVLITELKELIRNRKRNSSQDVKSQLIMNLSWKKTSMAD